VKDLLLCGRLPGENWEASLDILGVEFKQWCTNNNITHQGGLFTLSTLGLAKLGQFPVLHSRVKGAHCRILIAFMAHKAVQLDTMDWHSKRRTACLWGLQGAENAKQYQTGTRSTCASKKRFGNAK